MPYVVGPKGQVVIAKEIRERLGIQPGWLVLQRLADDHVALYFVPPEHDRSLKGSLAPYTDVRIAPGEAWEGARERAWDDTAQREVHQADSDR